MSCLFLYCHALDYSSLYEPRLKEESREGLRLKAGQIPAAHLCRLAVRRVRQPAAIALLLSLTAP